MYKKIYPINESTETSDFLSQNYENKTIRHESINFDERSTENFVDLNFSNPLLTKLLIIDSDIEAKLIESKKATIGTLEYFIKSVSDSEMSIISMTLILRENKKESDKKYILEIMEFFSNFNLKSITHLDFFQTIEKFEKYLKDKDYLNQRDIQKSVLLYKNTLEKSFDSYFKDFISHFKEKYFNFESANILFTYNDIEKSLIKDNNPIMISFLKYLKENKIILNKITSNYMIYSIDSNNCLDEIGQNIDINLLLKNIEDYKKKYNINTIMVGDIGNANKNISLLEKYSRDNNIKIIPNDLIVNFQKLNKTNAFINSLLKNKLIENGKYIKNYFTNSDKLYSFDLLKIKDFSISYLTKTIVSQSPISLEHRAYKNGTFGMSGISLYEFIDNKDYSVKTPKIDINVIDLDITSKNELNSFGFLRRKFNTDLGFSKTINGVTIKSILVFIQGKK